MQNKIHEKLWNMAQKSLEANIRETAQGLFVAAGSHQFGSLWTRDFCFSVRGLIAIGRREVAENHLSLLIETRRPGDHVIARVLECVPSSRRVLTHTIFRFLPETLKRIPMVSPLKAEHLGEHGTISIDSNPHVLRSAADVLRAGGTAWFEKNRNGLQDVLEFSLTRTKGGTALIEQGRFEDWQDSSAREGRTSYVNFLQAIAFNCAREMGLKLPASADSFTDLVHREFFEPKAGVYRACTSDSKEIISLDANVLVINELKRGAEQSDLYRSLKSNALWGRAEIPGVSSFPNYPKDQVSWTCKGVGLRHYHDDMLWTWLSAQAAKSAAICGDLEESDRILETLNRVSERDGGVAEIHRPTKNLPMFENILYRSEMPFSWGSGCILEALEKRRSL
jgi:hypothetical protein